MERSPGFGVVGVLLCWWAGEEEGLLGSQYFVGKPTIPLAKVKGMLNVDMTGREDPAQVSCGDEAPAGAVFPDEYRAWLRGQCSDISLLGMEAKTSGKRELSSVYVPLTTLQQPTREIGAAAFAAMLDRVARPDGPPRDILLQTRLIVRRSCGAPAR